MADDRMSGGMKILEAIFRASTWWDATGRKMMRHVNASEIERSMSAVLNGEPWDLLNRREKHQVVKLWHREFVVKAGAR